MGNNKICRTPKPVHILFPVLFYDKGLHDCDKWAAHLDNRMGWIGLLDKPSSKRAPLDLQGEVIPHGNIRLPSSCQAQTQLKCGGRNWTGKHFSESARNFWMLLITVCQHQATPLRRKPQSYPRVSVYWEPISSFLFSGTNDHIMG